MYTTLISASQLQKLLTSRCMIFDCSFDLAKPQAGAAMFAQSHIVHAVHADLDRHLSTSLTAPRCSGGRHPLPTREQFAAWLSAIGFENDMQAVVYDRQGVNYCGRLWWMLKWAGHEAVAVLDGGLQAWQAAGGAVESGVSNNVVNVNNVNNQNNLKKPSNFVLKPARVALRAIEYVAKNLAGTHQTIVDARAPVRFRGEVEPLDPVAGHIPGALNRLFTQNIAANGCFKHPTELRAEFEALLAGRNPATVVHQCGSGVTAIPNLLAMEIAGLGRTALFAGSWSEWCSDPSRPVAQG